MAQHPHTLTSRLGPVSKDLFVFLLLSFSWCLSGCTGITVHSSEESTLPLVVTVTSLPQAKTQTSYSASLTASGGKSPYTWSIASGSLPGGLTLNATSGEIAGIPAQAGTASFSVQVKDSSATPQTATQVLGITVSASVTALSISTTALSNGQQGTAYSAQLSATGGTAPYGWSIAVGVLPAGLNLNASTGQISGTPTQAGITSFTVQAKDASSPAQMATQPLSITVNSSTTQLAISTQSVPNAQQNVAYNTALSATGGTNPYTWSLASGQLPAGISLSATGVISGTPTNTGTFYFTAKVSDSGSPAQTALANLSLVVSAAVQPLQITSTALPAAQTSTAYDATVATSGGTAPYTWAVHSGSLPPGLILSTQGAITGTPTLNGSFTFVIQVTDSSSPAQSAMKSFTISVALNGGPLQITLLSTPNGQASVAYSVMLTAIGGTKPYTWSITSGALPPSLSISNATSTIGGTPTQAGTYSFNLQVQDSSPTPQTASQSFTIIIAAAFPPVQISTTSLAGGQVSSTYDATLTGTGGKTPYTWSVISGSLPAGLVLNSSTGQISGTPSQAGTSTFTVQVKDSSSTPETATQALSIVVTAAVNPISITTSSLTNGQQGTAYTTSLAAIGGTTPYSWSMSSGALPAGVALNVSTGQISGTPTTSGTFDFAVKVTDSTTPTAQTTTKAFSIIISATVTPVSITTSSLANGQQGAAYSATLAASGGTTPYTWSLSAGALPIGLSLNSSTGVISGTPTGNGTSNLTVKVTDSTTPTAQTATKALSIPVSTTVTPVSITTSSLAGGQQGTTYSATLAASGGTTPYSWSVVSSSLPPGLNLTSASGTISGTPTASGTFSFTIQVTDSTTPTAQTATRGFSIAVTATSSPVTITTTTLPGGQQGNSYSATVAATGGVTPYTWAVASGALPAGLSLNSATGIISGTPTATDTSNFTLKVMDSTAPAPQTSTANLSINITSSSGYSVLLTWTASPSSGVTGYNVYRSQVSGGGYTKVNSAVISGLSYTDASVANGQTYYYVTTSVNAVGDESGYSEEVEMVIP